MLKKLLPPPRGLRVSSSSRFREREETRSSIDGLNFKAALGHDTSSTFRLASSQYAEPE